MGALCTKNINKDFFKKWSSNMAYILGYTVADGCIGVSKNRKNPYSFNITSIDRPHLYKMRNAMGSNHKISNKSGKRVGTPCYEFQTRNPIICQDLIKLGIVPRKTYNLKSMKIPKKYLSDFSRGFFDGDGSVYIYKVNEVPQIKASFVCISYAFLNNFNYNLCQSLNIPEKSLQKTKPKGKESYFCQYHITLYISDCEKLFKFMYGNSPELYLTRKYNIFKKWKTMNLKRRHYVKKNYPSKIGWHLNEKLIK